MLSILCAISYWSITYLLARAMSVSRNDDLLGGMWAVVATIFVYRNSRESSLRAAISHLLATSLSFVLCLAYLLVFSFRSVGMVALIGIGAVTMSLINRPNEITTTAITTAVVMVVSALSPNPAWKEPIYRLVDTVIGAAVGTVGMWFTPNATESVRR
jgi:uncharacterized membrane protein YgaE (UPF0421/DUF939 family)